jgi:hypothetical protein
MGDVTALLEDRDFITDFARYCEGLLDEKFLRRKYQFAESVWEGLGRDDALVKLIEDEKLRRIRDGSSKRERAQQHVIKAPDVLSGIMLDPGGSAKHKIDAAKVLDQFADNGPQSAPASERFVIQINLGADANGKEIVERYSKSIAIDVNDTEPNDPNATTQELVAIVASNKQGSEGSGQPV